MGIISKILLASTYLSIGVGTLSSHGISTVLEGALFQLGQEQEKPPSLEQQQPSITTRELSNAKDLQFILSTPGTLYYTFLWPMVWAKHPSFGSRVQSSFDKFQANHHRPWDYKLQFPESNDQWSFSLKSKGEEDHFEVIIPAQQSSPSNVGTNNITSKAPVLANKPLVEDTILLLRMKGSAPQEVKITSPKFNMNFNFAEPKTSSSSSSSSSPSKN